MSPARALRSSTLRSSTLRAAAEREQMFLDEVTLLAELMILANDSGESPALREIDQALGLPPVCRVPTAPTSPPR